MSRTATNFTVIDQALVSGTNFITGLALARFLGMEAYGLFILLSGVILFASNIQNAIIVSPMMVNGPARETEQAHRYYQTNTILQSLSTLVFFAAIIVLGSALNQTVLNSQIDGLILPLALATSGLLMQEYFRRYFFSNKNTIHALINDTLSYGLQLLTIIAIHLIYGITVETCLYIMAATSYIAVTHGLIASKLLHGIRSISKTEYKDTCIEHWEFGKWLVARNMTYWVSTQLVIYLTGLLLSTAAVGAMAAARNIVGIVNILFLALENFATPRATNAYKQKGITGLKSYIKRISILGGIVTATIALIASAAPEFWLDLLYTNEYKGYGWVVTAWSLFFFIGYFQRPYGLGLRVTGNTKSIFTGTLISGVLVLLLSYPLIMAAHLAGAMSILILSQLSITIYYIFIFYKNLQTNS